MAEDTRQMIEALIALSPWLLFVILAASSAIGPYLGSWRRARRSSRSPQRLL